MQGRPLVCIGLGGICEGYLPHLLLLHETGIVRFKTMCLVDGKCFREDSKTRQHFHGLRSKAVDRCETWREVYQNAPLRHLEEYVGKDNVAEIVTDGSIVFLSPDNHATRKVVSDHAETLRDILLTTGSNDGIEEGSGGTEGVVIVHWKRDGRDMTAPITKYHPEIAAPADPRLPTQVGCLELARSVPQLLATNLLVGHAMVQMLMRYVLMSPEEAVQVVEFGVNTRDGSLVPYGIHERRP
jgi:hypothetical protein